MALSTERRYELEIKEYLGEDHHPFLDKMRLFFSPYDFKNFLEMTEEALGTLDPEGDIPVDDEDVLDHIYETVELASGHLTKEQKKNLTAAAYFSVWAYGTNPNTKKRYRYEYKPDSDQHQPYAMHTARVARGVCEMDYATIAAGYVHDVIEDTNYGADVIRSLFGSEVAQLASKVTKISTDSLENLKRVEVGVAREFLSQFIDDPDAAKAILFLEQCGGNKDISVQRLEDDNATAIKYAKGEIDRQIYPTPSRLLEKYARTKADAQILTLMRLFNVIGSEDDIKALILKCEDVGDNMEKIEGLTDGKGIARAQEKAKLAIEIFAPLAHVLGLHDTAAKIELYSYAILHSQKASQIREMVVKKGTIDQEKEQILRGTLDQLIDGFTGWANNHYALQFAADTIHYQIRYPTIYEIHKYKIHISGALKPFIEFYPQDEFIAQAFERYLALPETNKNYNTTFTTTEYTDDGHFKRINLQMSFAGHLWKLTGFIRDSSGEIVDAFKMEAPERRRNSGRVRLKALQDSYKSGDFSDFIERMHTGSKVVTFVHPRETGRRAVRRFIHVDATLSDALVIGGYSPKGVRILRNDKPVVDTQIESGDVIEVDQSTSDYDLSPDTIDTLQTDQAIKIYIRRWQIALNQRYINENVKQKMSNEAMDRGIRILMWMADAYEIQREYTNYRGNNNPSAELWEDEFWKTLLHDNRDLIKSIVSDDFLSDLGLTARQFPLERDKFNLKSYKNWLRTPGLSDRLRQLNMWIDEHMFILGPGADIKVDYNGIGDNKPFLIGLSDYIRGLYDDITIYTIDTGDADHPRKGRRFVVKKGKADLPTLQEGERVIIQETYPSVVSRILVARRNTIYTIDTENLYAVIDRESARSIRDKHFPNHNLESVLRQLVGTAIPFSRKYE